MSVQSRACAISVPDFEGQRIPRRASGLTAKLCEETDMVGMIEVRTRKRRVESRLTSQPPDPSGLELRDDNSGLPVRWNLKDLDGFSQRLVLIGRAHKAKKLSAPSTNDMDGPTGRSDHGVEHRKKAGVVPNQDITAHPAAPLAIAGLYGRSLQFGRTSYIFR
jgi:hypothetical protein